MNINKNLNKNKNMIKKFILSNLLCLSEGDNLKFPLPIYKELSYPIERFKAFKELTSIVGYLDSEEIIGSIINEYTNFLVDQLIELDLININL